MCPIKNKVYIQHTCLTWHVYVFAVVNAAVRSVMLNWSSMLARGSDTLTVCLTVEWTVPIQWVPPHMDGAPPAPLVSAFWFNKPRPQLCIKGLDWHTGHSLNKSLTQWFSPFPDTMLAIEHLAVLISNGLTVALVKHMLPGPTCSELFSLKTRSARCFVCWPPLPPCFVLLEEHYRLHFWQDPRNAVFYWENSMS